MKLKDFAKKIGVSPSRLSNWITGISRPESADMLFVVAAACGMTPQAAWRALVDNPKMIRDLITAMPDDWSMDETDRST